MYFIAVCNPICYNTEYGMLEELWKMGDYFIILMILDFKIYFKGFKIIIQYGYFYFVFTIFKNYWKGKNLNIWCLYLIWFVGVCS